jgi:hypothetical protein
MVPKWTTIAGQLPGEALIIDEKAGFTSGDLSDSTSPVNRKSAR